MLIVDMEKLSPKNTTAFILVIIIIWPLKMSMNPVIVSLRLEILSANRFYKVSENF